jgi:hypothetical protein
MAGKIIAHAHLHPELKEAISQRSDVWTDKEVAHSDILFVAGAAILFVDDPVMLQRDEAACAAKIAVLKQSKQSCMLLLMPNSAHMLSDTAFHLQTLFVQNNISVLVSHSVDHAARLLVQMVRLSADGMASRRHLILLLSVSLLSFLFLFLLFLLLFLLLS